MAILRIQDLIRIIKKQWVMIFCAVLVSAALTVVIAFRPTPVRVYSDPADSASEYPGSNRVRRSNDQ